MNKLLSTLFPNHRLNPQEKSPSNPRLQFTEFLPDFVLAWAQKAKHILFIIILTTAVSDYVYARSENNEARYYTYSEDRQRIQLIEEGCTALYLRLKLIEEATQSIDVEFFKYAPDRSGRVFNQALVKKAQEGIEVRVLLDYYGAYKKSGFDKKFVQFLQDSGVKVRFYNPASLYRPRKLLHRNHRKTLIIDSERVILGGRNQLDRFFELDPDINRFDREVYLVGSIAEEIRRTFDLFWNSRYTSELGFSNRLTAKQAQRMRHSANYTGALDFFMENEADRNLIEETRILGAPMLKATPVFISECTEYVSDTPYFKSRGEVMKHVYGLLSNADEHVIIETLCFTPQKEEENIFLNLLDSKVAVSVLTNSLLVSTNRTASAIGHRRSRRLISRGLRLYAYDGGHFFQRDPLSIAALDAQWSIHTKSVVVDCDLTMIGSCNFNPRARNFDSEHILIFHNNPQVAKFVEGQFEKKTIGAGQLMEENRYSKKIYGKDKLNFPQKMGNSIAMFLMRPFISAL